MFTRPHRRSQTNTRTRSASTASRPAVSVLVIVALTILSGCAAPRIIRETPTAGTTEAPTATATATAVVATPAASPTSDTGSFTIDRVAFSTRIDQSDAPIAETTVVSEKARQIYLCVHVSGIRAGAPFRAYWIENEQIIGQSDAISIETRGRPTWVALEFRPPFQLKPDAEYAVELLIDNEKVDRYMFRAGLGDPAKAIAEAAFASGFNAAGKPTGVRMSFPSDAPELVFRARVSNMVDPAGWNFTTLWYRDDVLIAQLGADPTDDARLLAFTMRPNGSLPPGSYSVSLLLNGVETRTVPFEITAAGSAASEEPAVTATMPAATSASVSQIVLTDRIDPRTSAPSGDEISTWEATEQSTADLWLAIEVEQLTRDDVLEVRINEAGSLYANERLPRQANDAGWVGVPVSLAVPSAADGPVEYTVAVLLNGNRTQSVTVLIIPSGR